MNHESAELACHTRRTVIATCPRFMYPCRIYCEKNGENNSFVTRLVHQSHETELSLTHIGKVSTVCFLSGDISFFFTELQEKTRQSCHYGEEKVGS